MDIEKLESYEHSLFFLSPTFDCGTMKRLYKHKIKQKSTPQPKRGSMKQGPCVVNWWHNHTRKKIISTNYKTLLLLLSHTRKIELQKTSIFQ